MAQKVTIRAPLAGAFLFVWLLGQAWAASYTAQVQHVIDGDSLLLTNGQQLRLIGVNTPEMVGPDGAPQPLAHKARQLLANLIGEGPIRIYPGQQKKDHYGRLLVYVETVDGRDVQQRLLSEGLGFLVAIPPNLDRLIRYKTAQDQARGAKRGIWALADYAPIEASSLDPASHPGGFAQIRGTITAYNASRRYHYFRMGKNFELKIPKAAWTYFGGPPRQLLNRSVIARGWINQGKYRLQMQVAHPDMLELKP